ncbi:MAG: LysM peptidoglycan-binding domain-containing M23 family metallopeptidase [Chloroflexota bacterium]|nr:LysM peptidoglycan-binding domain-containing M23 family metallopeptidase [Chloroflexota bacterium]
MDENADSPRKTEENDNHDSESAIRETDNADKITIDKPIKTGFIKLPLVLRIGLYAILFSVMVLIVWGIGSLIVSRISASPEISPTPTSKVEALPSYVSTLSFSADDQTSGVIRQPKPQFDEKIDVEERNEVTTYTVETGDTIFGIAEKFDLMPETVLWSNRYIIGDTPDGLVMGLDLYILPVDGVYHKWSEGEGLNGVASFYNVDPDVIVNYPGNGLDPATIGDYANPNIEPGTMLIVPDGVRPTISWVVARDEAASGSSYLGPGACGGIIYGNVGTGTFTWPTTATWLSGYDYTPPVHNGLDFDGDFGSPIYASDTGVIVYSGWSDRGYGNLIVVDHDDGWQTFYAHLMDGTLLPCGTNVQKGQLMASMGSTGNSSGPHLHFELRLNGSPMNPWLFLN